MRNAIILIHIYYDLFYNIPFRLNLLLNAYNKGVSIFLPPELWHVIKSGEICADETRDCDYDFLERISNILKRSRMAICPL